MVVEELARMRAAELPTATPEKAIKSTSE